MRDGEGEWKAGGGGGVLIEGTKHHSTSTALRIKVLRWCVMLCD